MTRLLVLVFFLSGLSSLVYQVAWQRLLTLYYGVGSVSITLIVSVTMLGLGLGALSGGWIAERLRRRILAYSAVELMIGAFGLASPALLDALGRQTAGAGYGVSLLAMSGFLLIPTWLMGATLPLLVKILNQRVRDFVQTVSLLYFVNTLGAALGALASAYLLITFWGLDVAVQCAACINLVLAVGVLPLRRIERNAAPPVADRAAATDARVARRDSVLGPWALVLVFVSGFLAIGYEIAWFRLVGILIKASPYAFATALSVYLLGIALGSYAMSRLLAFRRDTDRIRLFFGLQFAIGLSVVLTVGAYYHLTGTPDTGFALTTAADFRRELHPAAWNAGELAGAFRWPLYFELLPTLLIGASFPLLADLALSRPDREGATVGAVYFVNTMGNLLGGVVTGFVLLAVLGLERTLLAFASVNLLVLLCATFLGRAPLPRAAAVGAVAAAVAASLAVMPGRTELYRVMHPHRTDGFEGFFEEGPDAVVATFRRGDRIDNYINGMGHGGRPGMPFALQTLETLRRAPAVEEVLVVGFGTGTITEIALASDEVGRVTVVELSDTLISNLRKIDLFEPILSDERVELVQDDARRFLLRSEDTYDLVLMDPLRTTTSHSNNLYSSEFFALVREHLEPCGVLMLWSDDAHVVPRTAASAFPYAAFYNVIGRRSFLILASQCPLVDEEERLERILERLPARQRNGLSGMLRRFRPSLGRAGILERTDGLPVNRDWRPVSEYYLGLPSRLGSKGPTL